VSYLFNSQANCCIVLCTALLLPIVGMQQRMSTQALTQVSTRRARYSSVWRGTREDHANSVIVCLPPNG